jgi:hypothetical protein
MGATWDSSLLAKQSSTPTGILQIIVNYLLPFLRLVCRTLVSLNTLHDYISSLTYSFCRLVGVFLTTLTFVQEGSKDILPDNLVNFRKRQKASEVIQDIKRWQSRPHNFQPLAPVLVYIEESLAAFSDQPAIGERFWKTSLEREPREREDEKMARLLQESGFL